MARVHAILLATLLPALVGGCFPNPDYHNLPDASVITSRVVPLRRVTVADIAAPTPEEKAAIAAALAEGGETGLRVRVRLPQGRPQPSGPELRRDLEALGVAPAIAIPEAGTGPEGTELAFERIVVQAPDCAQMVTPSEEVDLMGDRPSMAFGCATYRNLAHMVADPADLAAPGVLAPPDATTAAAAVGRFQADKVVPLKNTSSGYGASNGGGGGSSSPTGSTP